MICVGLRTVWCWHGWRETRLFLVGLRAVFLQQFLLWFCRARISSIPPMRVDVDTTYVAVLSFPRVGLSNGMQHVGVADVRSPGGGVSDLAAVRQRKKC